MGDIQFRMAAKTDVGLERSNNEDNFQLSANLEESPMKWVNNQKYSLGRKGALLVVADGMGGMNAGEVASEIAINTIRDIFKPENITDEVVKNRYSIEKFMKNAVVEADKRIRDFANIHPESRGMGTTIVIGWLFDGNLYVTWCGDSRAYIFNPQSGLFQISKDHSYVQQLVDHGKISKEDAFDFPDSNIITRSLCDTGPKAQPDCLLKPQPLCNGDIIILCSDGLNAMIRDREIESIVANHQSNMTECVDTLIQAALDAAGADNCTVALCQILSGGAESNQSRIPSYGTSYSSGIGIEDLTNSKKFRIGIFLSCAVIILACIIGGIFWNLKQPKVKPDGMEMVSLDSSATQRPDTLTSDTLVPVSPTETREGRNGIQNTGMSSNRRTQAKNRRDKTRVEEDEKVVEDTGLGFNLTPISTIKDKIAEEQKPDNVSSPKIDSTKTE